MIYEFCFTRPISIILEVGLFPPPVSEIMGLVLIFGGFALFEFLL
mgnify:CR=1 FL=1